MIRKQKALLAAALALVAIGAINASGAQAAEEFHCSVAPCRYRLVPDLKKGEATSHQVLVIKNPAGKSVSFTCEELSGDGTTVGKTATELETTGLAYTGCTAFGEEFIIHMNGCFYRFTSVGGRVEIICPGAKHIEITIPATKCVIDITPQDLFGIKYHNIGSEAGGNTEVTVEANVPNIAIEYTSGNCLIDTTNGLTGTFTTGNTRITGETDPGEVMAGAWWK